LAAARAHATRSDLLVLLESEWEPHATRILRQIRRAVNPARQHARDEQALLISVLAAFPDRVARRRQGPELQLGSGNAAVLSAASTVTDAEFLVAVEIEDRPEQKLPVVRIASAIEPEWLLDLFPDRLTETSRLEWNRDAERVEAVSALCFDRVIIQESRGPAQPSVAGAMLAAKAVDAGIGRFADEDEISAFLARAAFAAEHSSIPRLQEEHTRAALVNLSQGLRSFAELKAAARDGGLIRALAQQLPPGAMRCLDELAPTRIRLRGGRQVRVHYEAGRPPWIASRLQDFFGMRETPRLAGGKAPVVVHLLAPNHRPIQMTTDLAGFWERLYPQVRRELSRRYPRHAWPEAPKRQ